MTPEHRFALIMAAIGVLGAFGLYLFQRVIGRQDALRADIASLREAGVRDSVTFPQWEKRMDRVELAIGKLVETVALQGVQIATQIGRDGVSGT